MVEVQKRQAHQRWKTVLREKKKGAGGGGKGTISTRFKRPLRLAFILEYETAIVTVGRSYVG